MKLLFATSNSHKVDEVRAILQPLGFTLCGLDDLESPPPEPIEDGATFAVNARIKAVAYAAATDRLCLADDSGLEVDALGGAPGVHSARYARRPGDDTAFDQMSRAERDRANNAKMLNLLRHVPESQRTARFVCAMCLARPDGTVLAETRGTFDGRIIDEERGSNGFGYDPLFFLPDLGRTSAELPPEEKNARSHRGAAVRLIADEIRRLKDNGAL